METNNHKQKAHVKTPETKEMLTDTPKDEELTIKSDLNSKNPFKTTGSYYPGDSVNEHKELEEANAEIAQEEIQQVYNNQ
ncbi:hypothetical protein [Desertibacillus haloalkaliphilus]|uniref:hypothetical protein n=1 Tax=Desertibacillus haloalkaliphilus TaxID=1328930 RepID=UPI001C258E17|nr:hypothetical protein [Desertibacillus haloalkaliphilus]MBU8908375.1 hypothetical protein [Desertibacillus haloalkaliphilus]